MYTCTSSRIVTSVFGRRIARCLVPSTGRTHPEIGDDPLGEGTRQGAIAVSSTEWNADERNMETILARALEDAARWGRGGRPDQKGAHALPTTGGNAARRAEGRLPSPAAYRGQATPTGDTPPVDRARPLREAGARRPDAGGVPRMGSDSRIGTDTLGRRSTDGGTRGNARAAKRGEARALNQRS